MNRSIDNGTCHLVGTKKKISKKPIQTSEVERANKSCMQLRGRKNEEPPHPLWHADDLGGASENPLAGPD